MGTAFPLLSPAVGVFQTKEPVIVNRDVRSSGVSYVEMASNMRVEERRWHTRHRWRELCPTPSSAADEWGTTPTQGAVWHNFDNTLVESAGGKLFKLTISAKSFSVADISGGLKARPSMRLAWLASGDKFVIRTDGVSRTQIYDGTRTVESTGYNPDSRDASLLPNYAGPVTFTDRFWIVTQTRDIIAADTYYTADLSSTSDLIRTRTTATDITADVFPPPQSMGQVHSLFVLSTSRGGALPSQAEVVAGTTNPGMWGILGGSPRSQWSSLPMREILHPTSGPTGPNAAATGRNEFLYRSPEGIESLHYFGNQFGSIGTPEFNLAQEMKPTFDSDPTDLLVYASVVNPPGRQRIACTVWPEVHGASWRHNGFVTATLQPGRTRVPEPMVWEGVSTLPAALGKVVMFLSAAQRVFAITVKPDGTKGLVEWLEEDGPDEDKNGIVFPQKWQILTRRLLGTDEFSSASWKNAWMIVRGIQREVKIDIFARGYDFEAFTPVKTGLKLTNSGFDGAATTRPIPLGPIFGAIRGPWVQILIKGEGQCDLDFAIDMPAVSAPRDTPDASVTCVSGALCNFNAFNP